MTAKMPRAVGISIATVAVLETNADRTQVMPPNARMMRTVDFPTPGMPSTKNANRCATPCLSIAWARMNAPMKVRIVVDPKGANTSSAGATREQDDRRNANHAGDRNRHRLADPQHDDPEQHRCQGLLIGV